MKKTFFPRLAWMGIRKNRRLYLPYILSCVGMIMMFYIIHSLSYSPLLRALPGSGNIELVLTLGKLVIAFFALLFLFYTNSFLIRRRYREFGLYSVLGMDRRAISRVVFWESLTVAAVSLTAGLALGAALSKLAELGLLNAIHAPVDYRLTFSWQALGFAAGVFALIFALLLLKSLWQVRRAKPLELLHSENVGEKPPKANWPAALLGAVLLGAAYYLAVRIKSPLQALTLFFVAVLLVIAATYLLFMSGSVALCRALQKNKQYYYQKNHFAPVASMAFRMKRNGAGLASVCILSTMVLVMLSSTASLYIGSEDAIRSRFPRQTQLTIQFSRVEQLNDGTVDALRSACDRVFRENGVTAENQWECASASIAALDLPEGLRPDRDATINSALPGDALKEFVFITAAEYERLTGTRLALTGDEALVWGDFSRDEVALEDLHLTVTGRLDSFPGVSGGSAVLEQVVPVVGLVVAEDSVLYPLETLENQFGKMLSVQWNYAWDLDADDETIIQVYHRMCRAVEKVPDAAAEEGSLTWSGSCLPAERSDFYVAFGGLFFLGIVLSIVFIFAAAMIIYYKQVSEGYEDQSRFAIMRKVGMTGQDIRKSVNSQVLTVFFAPLLAAGLHEAFAFPMIWKILQLFHLSDLKLVLLVSAGAYLVFGLFYVLIYLATARAYYAIVSAEPES